jgi:molecular chaperone DnaK (HSP70)
MQFLGERRKLTPEQVMASLLQGPEAHLEEGPVFRHRPCVLSFPVYYGEAERLAMLNSASQPGLQCLRLMNEPTATASRTVSSRTTCLRRPWTWRSWTL